MLSPLVLHPILRMFLWIPMTVTQKSKPAFSLPADGDGLLGAGRASVRGDVTSSKSSASLSNIAFPDVSVDSLDDALALSLFPTDEHAALHALPTGSFVDGIATSLQRNYTCYPNLDRVGQCSRSLLRGTEAPEEVDEELVPQIDHVACVTSLPTWSHLPDLSFSLHVAVVHEVSQVVFDIHQLERASSSTTASAHCAHMDDGAMVSTTDRRDLLWNYTSRLPYPTCLSTADHTLHRPTGFGYLRVPSSDPQAATMVPTFHTPSMAVTIISPGNLCQVLAAEQYQLSAHANAKQVFPAFSFLFPLFVLLWRLSCRPVGA